MLTNFINVNFVLIILINLLAGLLLLYAYIRLILTRNTFEMASFIVDPSLLLLISYMIHNAALLFLHIYRFVNFQIDPDKVINSYLSIDFPSKLYWLATSVSGLLFVATVVLFFHRTTKSNLRSISLIIPISVLLVGTGYIFFSSIAGFFIHVDYDIIRAISALIYLIGCALLIIGLNLELSKSTSSTASARIFMFRIVVWLLLIWIFISAAFSVVRLNSEFGTELYFLPSFVIVITAGITGNITGIFILRIIAIPEWVRKKFNISVERFQSYSNMQ